MAQATGVTLQLSSAAFDILVQMADQVEKTPEYRLMAAMKVFAQSLGQTAPTRNLDASEELIGCIRKAAAERGRTE